MPDRGGCKPLLEALRSDRCIDQRHFVRGPLNRRKVVDPARAADVFVAIVLLPNPWFDDVPETDTERARHFVHSKWTNGSHSCALRKRRPSVTHLPHSTRIEGYSTSWALCGVRRIGVATAAGSALTLPLRPQGRRVTPRPLLARRLLSTVRGHRHPI